MSDAYADGMSIGVMMKDQRAEGDYDYDCRYDLADAAKVGNTYFKEFKRGLEDGLKSGD